MPSAAFGFRSRRRVFSRPHAPFSLPSRMWRLRLPFTTWAQSVFPVVKPRALMRMTRPGAPSFGFSPTLTALTVIWSDAVSAGLMPSAAE